MNDTPPPRRSRRSATPARGNSLPLIPILIGVIVLGFVIGAGLSLVGKRGTTTVATVVRTAEPTLAPVTPAPTDPPTATDPPATKAPSAPVVTNVAPSLASHAPTASAAPASTATPNATATATAITTANATASAKATARATTIRATATPTAKAVAAVAPTPTVRATAKPIATVAPTAAPPSDAPVASDDVDSEFSKLASAVVRQYVGAIERGDDATAYASFGPSSSGVKLIESGVLDPSTRIQHVEARTAGNNATVNVDLKTAKGLYFGQFTVHRTDAGAALITDHALNKL